MLKQLLLKNFTLFKSAKLQFSPQINVIVGENGMGKSHLLKLIYAIIANNYELHKDSKEAPTKKAIENSLATKLLRVMRPDNLGRLVSRKQGKERCEVTSIFAEATLNTSFAFSTGSKTNVEVTEIPTGWQNAAPVYLPTRELLTIYPGFISLYENRHLELEETWRDTCLLLGEPLVRGQKEKIIRTLLKPLESALGGKVELDVSGRFYLKIVGQGRVEMPLVAEGMCKLAMIARLIATGALLDKGYLFWDEPEANLNPKLIREMASVIMNLSQWGIQIFIATHSYFLLKEIDLLSKKEKKPIQLIGLYNIEENLQIELVEKLADLTHFTALDEEIAQYDRELRIK